MLQALPSWWPKDARIKPHPSAIGHQKFEVIPDLWTDDLTLTGAIHTALIEGVEDAAKGFKYPDNSPWLTPEKCYPGAFGRLGSLPGWYMSPGGVFPEKSERALPTSDQFDEIFRAVYDAVLDEVFSPPYAHRAVDMNAVSTSGPPQFTSDPEEKRATWLNIMGNLGRFEDHFEHGRWDALREEFNTVLAMLLTNRIQPEKCKFSNGRWASKDREVATYQGQMVVADKRIDGSIFERCRVRSAAGASFGMNAIVRAVERHIDVGRYPCWHVVSPEDIASRFEGCDDVVAFDFSQFDQSVPRWALERFCEKLPVQTWVRDFMKLALNAPMVIKGDSPATKRMLGVYGNIDLPTAGVLDRWYGVASGLGTTSLMDKVVGMSVLITLLLEAEFFSVADFKRDPRNFVHKILINPGPWLNMGDDTLIGGERKKCQKLRELVKRNLTGAFVTIGLEEPAGFLGNALMRDGSTWKCVPNLESMLVNQFVPERGIRTRMRQYFAIGWEAAAAHYARHPLYPLVNAVRERVVQEHLHYSLADITRAYSLAQQRELNLRFMNLTSDERLLLENPDRRHYGRVDMDNVRPEIAASIYKTVPYEDWGAAFFTSVFTN